MKMYGYSTFSNNVAGYDFWISTKKVMTATVSIKTGRMKPGIGNVISGLGTWNVDGEAWKYPVPT